MTRKHFESIAQNFARQNEILDGYTDQAKTVAARFALRSLAHDMCVSFRTINPNFNSAKFMHAAGFGFGR